MGSVNNRGGFCVAEEMICACVYVCVRERVESRDTRYIKHREYASRCLLTKETDSTFYKVGGGCFI